MFIIYIPVKYNLLCSTLVPNFLKIKKNKSLISKGNKNLDNF